MIDIIPQREIKTRKRKCRIERMTSYRADKTYPHRTRNGRGVVGRLRGKA